MDAENLSRSFNRKFEQSNETRFQLAREFENPPTEEFKCLRLVRVGLN